MLKIISRNSLFLDCLDQGCRLGIEYYHRPINNSSVNPSIGSGIVIGITNYQGRERVFIITLAEAMGMVSQEIFAKKDKNGARKSTHLVTYCRLRNAKNCECVGVL